MSGQQINTLAAAAAKEQTRYARQGDAQAFYLSKDGGTIAMRQVWPPLREFSVETALGQSEQQHWQEARALAGPDSTYTATPSVTATAAPGEPERSARVA